MKNILKSAFVIMAVAAVAGGATWAYFSDTATVQGNTFSTGTLEVRVNGQESIQGFNFGPVAPGSCKEGEFTVMNYGAPHFGGPSNLSARELLISVEGDDDASDTPLCDALKVEHLKKCAGPCENVVTDETLDNIDEKNLLMSWYQAGGLIAGSSEVIKYKVCLPETNQPQNELQGKTCTFNFVVEAYNLNN